MVVIREVKSLVGLFTWKAAKTHTPLGVPVCQLLLWVLHFCTENESTLRYSQEMLASWTYWHYLIEMHTLWFLVTLPFLCVSFIESWNVLTNFQVTDCDALLVLVHKYISAVAGELKPINKALNGEKTNKQTTPNTSNTTPPSTKPVPAYTGYDNHWFETPLFSTQTQDRVSLALIFCSSTQSSQSAVPLYHYCTLWLDLGEETEDMFQFQMKRIFPQVRTNEVLTICFHKLLLLHNHK